jgi:hypothetical protein
LEEFWEMVELVFADVAMALGEILLEAGVAGAAERNHFFSLNLNP